MSSPKGQLSGKVPGLQSTMLRHRWTQGSRYSQMENRKLIRKCASSKSTFECSTPQVVSVQSTRETTQILKQLEIRMKAPYVHCCIREGNFARHSLLHFSGGRTIGARCDVSAPWRVLTQILPCLVQATPRRRNVFRACCKRMKTLLNAPWMTLLSRSHSSSGLIAVFRHVQMFVSSRAHQKAASHAKVACDP